MSISVGKLHLDLSVNTAGLKKKLAEVQKEAKKTSKGMSSMFGNIATAAAVVFSTRQIVNFSKECINLGSDLAEVQNVVDVTFGESAKNINAWAKTTSKAYGVSELSAKQYAGTMGAMLKSTGIATDAATTMSTTLAGLAGDMASFYNLETDEAFAKIRAGISGETEPLKQLGINLSVANLEAFALAKGIEKSYGKMSQAEQVLLRYNYLLETTADAQGDFARTADSWANQVRVLQLNFDSLKATLGQALINALTPCLQVVNQLLEKLQLVAQAIYDISVKLFGDAGGSSSASAATTAAESLASNTDAATQSAKEYVKTLSGVDKLNVVGSAGAAGGASGGGASFDESLLPSVTLPEATTGAFDTSAIQETLIEIAKIVGLAELALGAILAFTGVNIPLGIALMASGALTLAAAYAADWSVMKGKVQGALDLVTAVLEAASLAIGAILALTGVNIPLGIALMSIGAVGMAARAVINYDSMTNEVKLAITALETAVGVAVLALGAVLAFTGVNIPLGIALMAFGAVSIVSAIAMNWGALKEGIGSTVSAIAAIVGGALLGLGAVLAFTGAAVPLGIALMAAGAVSLAAAIAPNWSGITDETKNTIALIAGIAGGALLVLGIILSLTGVAIPLGLGLIAAGAASMAAGIVPSWNSLSDKTKNTLSIVAGIAGGALLAIGVILLITGVGIPLGLGLIAAGGASLAAAIAPNWDAITGKIKSACDKIAGFFSNMWDGVKQKASDAFNWISDNIPDSVKEGTKTGINWVSSGVNKVADGVGGLFGVDVPDIPKLATGGYVRRNTPQLAMIGDNLHQGEIVAPEGKITEAVMAALGPVIAVMQQLGASIKTLASGNGQDIVVKCYLDGKVVYESVVKQNNARYKQTGKSLLKI